MRDQKTLGEVSASSSHEKAELVRGAPETPDRIFKPTLHHLADRIGARLCAKSLAGHTITVRVQT